MFRGRLTYLCQYVLFSAIPAWENPFSQALGHLFKASQQLPGGVLGGTGKTTHKTLERPMTSSSFFFCAPLIDWQGSFFFCAPLIGWQGVAPCPWLTELQPTLTHW